MERVERPNERARRRERPAWPGLGHWSAPLEEQSGYAGITARDESRLGPEFAPRLLLVLAMLMYAYYFGKFALDRWDAFQQPGFDLGIFDQGLWLLSRFKEPFVSIMGLNLFGDHASYILLLLVPLYWIWPAAQALLLAQTLALCVAAIPVFLLARRALRNPWLALLPALAFLLNPALGWLNIENFHPDSFEVPLVLFALYLMTQHRWRWYMVIIVLLLSIKEDVALLVVPLGIYVALRHDKRMGLITAGVGMAWFVAAVFVLGPLFSGAGAGRLDAFRVPFGGWRGLVSTFLREPWQVGGYMLGSDKIKYLVQLLTPVFFLPVLTAGTLIVLPSLIFNLLSTFSYQTNIRYHYTSLIIPVFAWAALSYMHRVNDTAARRALAMAVLVASLFAAYAWGPLDWSRQPAFVYDRSHPEVQAIAEAVTLIPDDAVVSARSRMAAHLAHRDEVYEYPTPFYATYWGDNSQKGQWLPVADRVEYVLETPERLSQAGSRVFTELQEDYGFRPIYSKAGVVLLKKMAASSAASD